MIETEKHRVWNTSRDTLLCDELTLAYSTEESLESGIERVVSNPGAGLWLNPCIGAPHVEGAAPFDLVCIDQKSRVTEEYESFQAGTFLLFQPRTTSALIFPERTIAISQTQVGDQLEITVPEGRGGESPRVEMPVETIVEKPVAEAVDGSGVESEMDVRRRAAAEWGTEPGTEPEAGRQPLQAAEPLAEAAVVEKRAEKKDSLKLRFMRWLVPDRRKADRVPASNIVAVRWAGDQMHRYEVEDVSATGVYILTDERPLPGTVFMITLTKPAKSPGGEDESLSVQVKVARWGSDGLGLEFVTTDALASHPGGHHLEGGASSIQIQRFIR